jgi:hypothetical protein
MDLKRTLTFLGFQHRMASQLPVLLSSFPPRTVKKPKVAPKQTAMGLGAEKAEPAHGGETSYISYTGCVLILTTRLQNTQCMHTTPPMIRTMSPIAHARHQ